MPAIQTRIEVCKMVLNVFLIQLQNQIFRNNLDLHVRVMHLCLYHLNPFLL